MNKTVRMISRDSMFLALLIVCTFFTIDAGVTKFTLQLLAVFLIANFLPLADGLIIVTLYIAMGLIGIPVFAGFGGGPAYVLAPTFGFVYGFYFVILINHLFNDFLLRRLPIDIVRTMIGSIVSLVVLYVVGFIHGYLILVNIKGMTDLTIAAGLGIFITPYIPFDIAKVVIASILASRYMNLFVPYKRRHFDEIDSTNTYLLENYKYYGNMTFIDASYQKKGKGRMNRVWVSKKNDSLMFSVLIKDKELLQKAPLLSLLAGDAVLRCLEKENVANGLIKWPNDVYVNGKKICGILLESVSVGSSIKALVIGIGLNVNQDGFAGACASGRKQADVNLDCCQGMRECEACVSEQKQASAQDENHSPYKREPTSLKMELGREVEIRTLKKELYRIIKNELKAFKKGNSEYLAHIREHNYLQDKDCYCVYEGNEKQIHVTGIDDDGSLVGIIDGEEKRIFSDEITFK